MLAPRLQMRPPIRQVQGEMPTVLGEILEDGVNLAVWQRRLPSLGARRVGLRLRVLDKAMCPRFHVDHVPVRLITTYAGVGSEWLAEGAMDRRQLGSPTAEPMDTQAIRQIGRTSCRERV